MKIISNFFKAMAAQLEWLTTKIKEDAKRYPESQYLRGYEDGLRDAWQEGHDTALLHGQSENPYEQEPR